jgi:glycosyltransferase involved in cell wall biosynthesis
MPSSRPACSVVIPTSGRPQLQAAIASALSQVDVETEVIVVDDAHISAKLFHHSAVRFLRTPRQRSGANVARQIGIEAANHALIALLDDDDTWHPEKLMRQIKAVADLRVEHEPWIATSAIISMGPRHKTAIYPARGPACYEPLERYLFASQSFRRNSPFLQTSTFLFPRWQAQAVPFRPFLPLHQDWDWLLRSRERWPSLALIHVDEPLVYYAASTPSISRSALDSDSRAWAAECLLDPVIRSDFLLLHAARIAAEAGSVHGVLRCGAEALKCRSLTSYTALHGTRSLFRAILKGVQC